MENIFWPDLVCTHYAACTVQWVGENVHFLSKTLNPPNTSQARPIENFRTLLGQTVYDGGWQAKTEKSLVIRIRNKFEIWT